MAQNEKLMKFCNNYFERDTITVRKESKETETNPC